MTTFALVHGAWHGAWCWERLVPELEALGHGVTAMDLPCDDPAATFETYADVVADALAGAPDDLVLVGHSLAGHTIPLVAARRPVRSLVYLCALIAMPGRSLREQAGEESDMFDPDYDPNVCETDAEGRRRWVDEDEARRVFYADCDTAPARAAFERLRPQAITPYVEPCALTALPSTPSTYVVCREDRIVNPAWSRRAARERLHADLLELPGSHSPFLSRPSELAALLHDLD